jgi:ABC-type multidrug transport system fused ATPase/permease subunit
MVYFEKISTGKLLTRVTQGVGKVMNITSDIISSIAPQVGYIVVAGFILFKTTPIFGLTILIGAPLYFYVSLKYRKSIGKIQDEIQDTYEYTGKISYESIANIKTVRSFAKEDVHSRRLSNSLAKLLKAVRRRRRKYIQLNLIRSFISNSAQLFVLGYGAYLAASGEITIGTLVMATNFIDKAFSPLANLAMTYDKLHQDMRSVSRIIEIFETEPEVKDSDNAQPFKKVRGDIEFRDLNFSYEGKKVVRGFNLKVKAGQTIAIVGKSGEGKSTLIKLLLRFYDPQKGKILIDGQDIRNVTQKSLRTNIGVVLQDTVIFDDTAYDNIAYPIPTSPKNKVIKAAKLAHAHNFITRLPKKYNTILGERGVKLSGGEQQRINIARVVLKDPPILVLDEATSHLDSENEKLIQDALENLIKGRTTIIIAHRLSTVMKADQIVIIDKGRVAEIGTHDELIKKGDIYYQLFQIQSGGYLS